MRLTNKKVAILVSNEFEDIELLYPLIRLSEEGAWITIGTLQIGFHPRPAFPDKPITGRFGSTVPPIVLREGRRFDLKPIADMNPDDYDALIVPGGFSPDYLRRDPKTLEFVRGIHKLNRPIASICHGPWLLISAGIVRGKNMTCVSAIKDDLINAGANYQDAAVVVDGNLISSRTPDDLPDMCLALIEAMARA
ncbi:MAG TPA: type 1 glutamine amidotransferase [Firmicutes bacterium]|nr:type 1 glutamine amidotransferase [Bacillota bacterium]